MSKDNQNAPLMVLNLVWSIANVILQVYIFTVLYGWHVQTQFNLPELTKWHAFGIMLTARAFRTGVRRAEEKVKLTDEEDASFNLGMTLFLLALLGMGFVAR